MDSSSTRQIVSYYESLDARLFYACLGGVRHFGYFPPGQERIPLRTAQAQMTERLGVALALPPGSLVLDAGCGEGPVAVQLARSRGLRVVGVDLVPLSIRRAWRRARRQGVTDRVEFRVADYSRLSFPDDMFDAAYTMETLVHAVDYRAALTELRRVLKPGGRIALFEYTVPPPEALTPEEERIGRLTVKASGMHSLPAFTHGSFAARLLETGFEDVEIDEITARVMPMYRRMYRWSWLPYQLIRLLGQRRRFLTVTAVVETYPHALHHDAWRYIVATARKPLAH